MKIKFNIVTSDSSEALVVKINSLLSDEWMLHGNLNAAFNGNAVIYSQAIIKEIHMDKKASSSILGQL